MKTLKSTYTEIRMMESDFFQDRYGDLIHLTLSLSIHWKGGKPDKWKGGKVEDVKFIISCNSSSRLVRPFSVDFDNFSAAAIYYKNKSDFYKDFQIPNSVTKTL